MLYLLKVQLGDRQKNGAIYMRYVLKHTARVPQKCITAKRKLMKLRDFGQDIAKHVPPVTNEGDGVRSMDTPLQSWSMVNMLRPVCLKDKNLGRVWQIGR